MYASVDNEWKFSEIKMLKVERILLEVPIGCIVGQKTKDYFLGENSRHEIGNVETFPTLIDKELVHPVAWN